MIKTCIIGVSGYGRIHYDLLLAAQAAGKVEIVGAAIINQDDEAEKCARLKELGCRLFDDYQTMLQELSGSAEFCMIPTGTPLHRPMTVAALEAGMHVLVEKPAAGCIEDVHAMQETAERAGRVVALGYQHMYAPSVLATKQYILEGGIGKLESIKCLVMWPREHAYYTRNGWAGKLTVDGTAVNDSPVNNAVAHDLMMMLFQAGTDVNRAAMPISVEAELYRANAIESFDTACMRIETAEGVPIRFYATHACREQVNPEIHIRGSKGSIVMTHRGSVITPRTGDAITVDAGDVREAMMTAVLNAVQGESIFFCNLEMASRQTMVISALHEACTIHAVDGDTVTAESGTASTLIPGIEEALRGGFDREQFLQVCGVSWAQQPDKAGII